MEVVIMEMKWKIENIILSSEQPYRQREMCAKHHYVLLASDIMRPILTNRNKLESFLPLISSVTSLYICSLSVPQW